MTYVLRLFMLTLHFYEYKSLSASTTPVSDQATLFDMAPLAPTCEKGVITSFKYVTGGTGTTMISYNYVENSTIESTIFEHTTTPTASNGTSLVDLRDHSLDCGSGYALSKFYIQNDGASISYAYECRKAVTSNCNTFTTSEFQSNAGSWSVSDLSHFKACPKVGTGQDRNVIQGFQLITRFNDTTGVGYFKYQYTQCDLMLCNVACNGCTAGGQAFYCKACATDKGYYPVIYKPYFCINSDPTGKYQLVNGIWDVKCYSSCLQCFGWGNDTDHLCAGCADGYYPKIDKPSNCYNQWMEGYFLNISESVWDKCYSTCLNCTSQGDSDDHQCVLCKSGFYHIVDQPKCHDINVELTGYYRNDYTIKMERCYETCNTCYGEGSADLNKCSLCKSGLFKIEYTDNCTAVCPYGYWKYDSQWIPCYISCGYCNGNGGDNGWDYDPTDDSHSCTECKTGYFPLEDHPENCYQYEQLGYYLNSTKNGWNKCYGSCEYCNGPGTPSNHNCRSCKTGMGYYPQSDIPTNCANTPPDGYILNYQTTPYQWDRCYETCFSCDTVGNPDYHLCKTCLLSQLYYPLTLPDSTINCYQDRKPGYFLAQQKWNKCYSSCDECTGPGDVNDHLCQTCVGGYHKLADKLTNCFYTSPSGYFYNATELLFFKCYSSCDTCQAQGTAAAHLCDTCLSQYNYYPLQDNSTLCYNTTPADYFKNETENRWDNCYSSCTSCTGLGTADDHLCITCKAGFFPQQYNLTKCYDTTPPAYFKNDVAKRWDKCYISCGSCTELGNVDDHKCTDTCNLTYYHREDEPTSMCYNETAIGYFFNTTESRWDLCYSSCANCTGKGTAANHMCGQCRLEYENYPLQDNSTMCYNTTPPGYFNNSALKRWDKCYSSCTSCTGLGTADDHLCITCKNGFFPQQYSLTKCYDTAPPAYFKNDVAKRWDKCYISCGSCTELGTPDNHLCGTCSTGYYPRINEPSAMCYNTASAGHYLNVNIWDLCYESCANCTAYLTGTDHMCTACATDYYPLQNQTSICLISTVPVSGYFYNDTANQWDNCYSSCDSCDEIGNVTDHLCTTCLSGFYPLEDKDTNCYDIALKGYYLNQNQWDLCYNSCSNCSSLGITDNHKCSECKTGYYFLQDNHTMCFCRPENFVEDGLSACSNTVPKEYYFNTSQVLWDLCYSSCDSCGALGTDNDHKCTKCKSTYYPLQDKNSSCYSTNQSYYFFNSTLERWDNCYPSCGNCSSLGDDTDHLCTECKVNYYPVQDAPSKCYDTAPYGYAFNITKWDHCYTSCDDCTSLATSEDHNCIHCKSGYHPLVNHTSMCFDQAQYGYYLNESMQRWDLCLSNCRYCTGLGTLTGEHSCTECAMDYGYYPLIDKPSRCYSTAEDGYYFNSTLSIWDKCFPSCFQCSAYGTEPGDHHCTKCQNKYYPLIDFQSKCYSTVQPRYFFNVTSEQWEHCFASCDSCLTLGTEDEHLCIQCYEGYYPLQDRYSMCYAKAPNISYIFNSQDKRWDRCYPSCKYCIAFGDEYDHKCTECIEPFYPLQDKPSNCLKTIPVGYFFNVSSLRWDNCYITCATCDELGTQENNKCASCITGYFAVETSNKTSFTCLETSPVGYYLDQGQKMHRKCVDTCATCEKNSTYCLSCNSSRFFINNTCIEICPTNYFQDSSTMTCLPCYATCKTCRGVGKSECLSCIDDSPVLPGGQCTGGCLDDELYIPSIPAERKCLNMSSCIVPPTLSVPDRFSIESSNFMANVSVKLTNECLQYQEKIASELTYEWSDLHEGKLSQGNTTLTIAAVDLKPGTKNFTVNVSFKVLVWNVTKICQFKTNKLVPVVANSGKLLFFHRYPITIDASLSYDEGLIDGAFSSNINDPDLVFEWKCPTPINTKCALYKNKKILTLTPDDYSGLNQQVQKASYIFTLKLSKDTRTSQLNLTVYIENLFYDSESSSSKKNIYENILYIQPLSRGMKGEDLIFQAKFLDPTINITSFGFYWTVGNLEEPAKYMNDRIYDILRMKNDDFLIGETVINLDFYEKSSPTIKYVKKYSYMKSQAPYGGNCQVNPSRGFSLRTPIAFSANRWVSNNLPLSYKFYMTHQRGFNVTLTNGTLFQSEYTTLIIPVGNKFFVDVIDPAGLSSTYPCTLEMENYTSVSPQPLVLNDLLDKATDENMKLLLVEAYCSNENPLDSTTVETAATILENILSKLSDEALPKFISQNMDIILSLLNTISSSNANSTPLIKRIDKIISIVVNNMDSIVQELKKVDSLLNNICNSYENINRNQEVDKTAYLKTYQKYIKEILIIVSQNLVPGQTVTFSTQYFDCQISKMSERYIPTLSIPNSDLGQEINEEECAPHAAACVLPDQLKRVYEQYPGPIATSAILNKKRSPLPIREEMFGETSFQFEIYITNEDTNSTLRILSSNDLKITYTVRLQAPYLNSSTVQTKINETACVQYDNNYISDSTSCATWYDYDTMEIVCICTKQGLTVNVFDKTFSSFSKLAQFPALTGDLINVYSLSIVCSLVFLLLVFLGIAYYKDKQDKKKKKYIASQYFDIMQYYIIRYTKEGFNKDYSIKRLYRYVLKTNHPLLSIMTIYSEKYYRQLRVLDFFLQLFISFFFTFLPLYASDNEVKIQNENSRNIKNISARFDELGLTIQQILNGIIYSILSNIISMIITLPLTLMIYSDVMKQESEKRKTAMQAMVRYYMTKRKSTYAEKFARGLLKIRTLILVKHKRYDLTCDEKEKENQLSPVKSDQTDITLTMDLPWKEGLKLLPRSFLVFLCHFFFFLLQTFFRHIRQKKVCRRKKKKCQRRTKNDRGRSFKPSFHGRSIVSVI